MTTSQVAAPPKVAPHEGRVTLDVQVPPIVGALLGQPGWSGLVAVLGFGRRSQVVELLLRRAIAVPVEARPRPAAEADR